MANPTSQFPKSPHDYRQELVAFLSSAMGRWIMISGMVADLLHKLSSASCNLASCALTLRALDSATRTMRIIHREYLPTLLHLSNHPLAALAFKVARRLLPSPSVANLPEHPATSSLAAPKRKPCSSISAAAMTTAPESSAQPDLQSPAPPATTTKVPKAESLKALAQRILKRCSAGQLYLERFASKYGFDPITPDLEETSPEKENPSSSTPPSFEESNLPNGSALSLPTTATQPQRSSEEDPESNGVSPPPLGIPCCSQAA